MWRTSASLLAVLGMGLASAGCGGADALQVDQVRPALQPLHYRLTIREVEPPPGATAAVVGRAIGPHQTDIDFAVSFGDAERPPPALAVPRSGKGNTFGCGSSYTLSMNDGTAKPHESKTRYRTR